MFEIGDKIVYPMHGAGVIKAIEEQCILGENKKYYVVHVSSDDMKIMVPVDTSELVGVRPVVCAELIDKAIEVLKAESTEMEVNWNRRYRENMEKLKTGDVLQVAEVLRNLVRNDRVKKLSTGEKKLMNNARQILLSEMVLVKDIDPMKAGKIIDEAI